MSEDTRLPIAFAGFIRPPTRGRNQSLFKANSSEDTESSESFAIASVAYISPAVFMVALKRVCHGMRQVCNSSFPRAFNPKESLGNTKTRYLRTLPAHSWSLCRSCTFHHLVVPFMCACPTVANTTTYVPH